MPFKVIQQNENQASRIGELKTAHGPVKTPVFILCIVVKLSLRYYL